MQKKLTIILLTVILPLLYSFKAFFNEQEWINWGNRVLNQAYAPIPDSTVRKWELTLTTDHFLRLRKTYQHGNQEYFSFKTDKFTGLLYHPGATGIDTLEFKTEADDIIYQTFENPKGDIDSMLTAFDLPVKSLTKTQVDSLRQAFVFLHDKPATGHSQQQ